MSYEANKCTYLLNFSCELHKPSGAHEKCPMKIRLKMIGASLEGREYERQPLEEK